MVSNTKNICSTNRHSGDVSYEQYIEADIDVELPNHASYLKCQGMSELHLPD